MKISANINLDVRRKKKDETYPLVLRLVCNLDSRTIPLEYSVTNDDWVSASCLFWQILQQNSVINSWLLKKIIYFCTSFQSLLYFYTNVFRMGKLQVTQILVENAKLSAVKLSETNPTILKMISETKQKQANVLKLKEVDQERLRMVVQL